ncbi:MAG: hypothetical protein V3T80_06120 [Kiloniellales bacterium]|jgi:hypothetical protein
MTKAKARQRAKAKAAQKAGKPEARKKEAKTEPPGQKIRPGQFDPGASSMKGRGVNVNAKNFAGARRGAARSK